MYREAMLTQLSEIANRLTETFSELLGCPVDTLKDSNAVDLNKINMNEARIQITSLDPIFGET